MIENLLVGGLTMVVCVAVQCVVVGLLLDLLLALERTHVIAPTIPSASAVLTVVLLVMLAGNLLQIATWAGLFLVYGEFLDFESAFYHSTVNFTTLGYGDVVMSPQHRLLGALEAANGVLMFGLTTSILFAVMQVVIRRGLKQRAEQEPRSRGH